MADWWSIEVFHADLPARRWKDSYEDALIEAALANGVLEWEWHEHRTGVVLELKFHDDAAWEAFRALPAVRAALDAAPDPVNGLIIYRGRGGSSGARRPRRRGPKPSAGALARKEPEEERRLDVTEAEDSGPPTAPDLVRAGAPGTAPAPGL